MGSVSRSGLTCLFYAHLGSVLQPIEAPPVEASRQNPTATPTPRNSSELALYSHMESLQPPLLGMLRASRIALRLTASREQAVG